MDGVEEIMVWRRFGGGGWCGGDDGVEEVRRRWRVWRRCRQTGGATRGGRCAWKAGADGLRMLNFGSADS